VRPWKNINALIVKRDGQPARDTAANAASSQLSAKLSSITLCYKRQRKNDMKNIEFILIDSQYSWVDKPIPAINSLPEWYKKMPAFANDEPKLRVGNRATNQTVKRCVPYMEAMTAGYYITLPTDVLVSKDKEGNSHITWLTQTDIIVSNDPFQVSNIDVPKEYELLSFKFINRFIIKTPPGYSSLLVHPINRVDLPFLSFSGIVDTDTHDVAINFPFIIRKDFEGVIKKGTPIIQIIPIKRDDWKASTEKVLSYPEHFVRTEKYFSHITRAYKKLAWHRKSYK
jgi:hypothetical protein